jgi:hypothetical protein
MPSPAHDGWFHILDVIQRAVLRTLTQGGFGCRIVVALTGDMRLYDRDNRLLPNCKEADGCLIIKIPGVRISRLPSMILEIGYSESYLELQRDARAWMTDYGREVLAVVLIKVSRPRHRHDFNPNNWKAFAEVWEQDPLVLICITFLQTNKFSSVLI